MRMILSSTRLDLTRLSVGSIGESHEILHASLRAWPRPPCPRSAPCLCEAPCLCAHPQAGGPSDPCRTSSASSPLLCDTRYWDSWGLGRVTPARAPPSVSTLRPKRLSGSPWYAGRVRQSQGVSKRFPRNRASWRDGWRVGATDNPLSGATLRSNALSGPGSGTGSQTG